MEQITSLCQLHKFSAPCVIALGTFDGLHLGHQDVILTAKKQAEQGGYKLVVFTFSNHPYALIAPDKVPASLITYEEKRKQLERLGVDVLVDIPFDKKLAWLAPDEFLAKLKELDYVCLVVGENFTYGSKGRGNVDSLAAAAVQDGFKLIVRPLVAMDETVISSTEIRSLISRGEVEEANKMLGRVYGLSGIVAHGNERGRLIGFPTANLELADAKSAIPARGVYAVKVRTGEGVYRGMANIGYNPTFGDVDKPRLEVNLFGFKGDLYDQHISVFFYARVRAEKKFAGIEELKQQIAADKEGISIYFVEKCQKICK